MNQLSLFHRIVVYSALLFGPNMVLISQAGLEGIIVERYYIADSLDSSTGLFPVPENAITYRLYIDLAPDWSLQAIFGSTNTSTGEIDTLVVRSTAPFFNNEDRGRVFGYQVPTANLDENTVLLDSWISTGRSSSMTTGVLKPLDNNGPLPAFPNINGLLQNEDENAGIPISVMDGNITGSSAATWTLIGITTADLALFDDLNLSGNVFVETDGAFTSFTTPLQGPAPENRILFGQFTTAGALSGKLNLQLRHTQTGVIQQWVAESPAIGQFTSPELSWKADQLPTVTITSPLPFSVLQSGQQYDIQAEAFDPDSAIRKVEFYFDGVLLDTDTTFPYSISEIATFDGYITVVAYGDQGGKVLSAPIYVQVNPYRVGSLDIPCHDQTFCVPVQVFGSGIADIIGFDIICSFDQDKIIPSGNIYIKSDMLPASYVGLDYDIDLASGRIQLEIFLNSNAPLGANYNGIGDILCIEFERRPAFGPSDSTRVVLDTIVESYSTGFRLRSEAIPSGRLNSLAPDEFLGSLAFWADFSPIVFDTSHPSAFSPTSIHAASMACIVDTGFTIQPDTNGAFLHLLDSGVSMQITRDIAESTDVHSVINGFDALLIRKVLLDELNYIPSAAQLIAMDVNQDGVISAGDVSQVNLRSVMALREFRQAWNYNANGNPLPGGESSKDWVFVRGETVMYDPAYQASSSYPEDNGVGYSRYRVPIPPFCQWTGIEDPQMNCAEDLFDVFYGILLGDVNGNYKSIPPDGKLK